MTVVFVLDVGQRRRVGAISRRVSAATLDKDVPLKEDLLAAEDNDNDPGERKACIP
jgi:hypothetical protein